MSPLPALSNAHPDHPDPPGSLGVEGRRMWARIWSAPWIDPVLDWPSAERLAALADERQTLIELVAIEGRTTRGSQGQLVEHPLVVQLRHCGDAIRAEERALSVPPFNRARLTEAVVKTRKRAGLN